MSKRKQLRAMDEQEEQELLGEQDPVHLALESFFAEGLITDILYPVKRGKEAAVYCCQAHPSIGTEFAGSEGLSLTRSSRVQKRCGLSGGTCHHQWAGTPRCPEEESFRTAGAIWLVGHPRV